MVAVLPSSIKEGNDVTIRCRILGRNIVGSGELVVTVKDFENETLYTQLNETFFDVNVKEYYAVVPSVTEDDTGEYICVAELRVDGHCIEATNAVYINVTSDEDYEGEIELFIELILTASSLLP